MLVLGYGNIGEQVAKYIKPLCKDLFVYDTNLDKQASATKLYKVSRNLTEADVIIGATGSTSHSITAEDLKKLKSGVILVSGSSKKVELDLDGFAKVSDDTELADDISTYHVGRKMTLVANSGEPINFRAGSLPSKVLDLVYGSLIYCANVLDMGAIGPGLHAISESDQYELEGKYLAVYKAKSLGELLRK